MAKVVPLFPAVTTANQKEPQERFARRKDGLYQLELRYTLPDGSKKKKSFYGKTQSEALKKRDDFRRSLDAGLQVDRSDITVSDWSKEWLAVFKANVTPNVKSNYQRALNRINKHMGERKLASITQSDAQKFVNSLAGKARGTIDNETTLLRALFNDAVSERILTHSPCGKLVKPKAERGTHRAIEPELQTLIAATWNGHRLGRAVMFMLFAGLRRGEALALESSDVSDVIQVSKALRFEKNRPIVAAPKTRAGVRAIPVMPQLQDVINGHVGLYASLMSGGHMSKSSFQKAWEGYVAYLSGKAGHAVDLQCHDLRHTFCTSLFDAGVSVKTAQKWMGHTDVMITMRIYTHLSEKKEEGDTNYAKAYFKNLSVNSSVKRKVRSRKTL